MSFNFQFIETNALKNITQIMLAINITKQGKIVAKLAAVASLYVQDEPDFRPNMSIVVRALQPLLKVAPAPVVTCD